MQNVDVNGTIMLLDLFIRKITGQKYISTESRSMSLLEAQAYALSIIEKFEQVLNETAVKSGISAKNLNFNRVAVSKEIAQHLRNGKFCEISKTLYSSAKEACPGFKQTDKFLAELKGPLEEIVNKTTKDAVQRKAFRTSHSRVSDRPQEKALAAEKPSTFLNGISTPKGLSNNRNEVKVLG